MFTPLDLESIIDEVEETDRFDNWEGGGTEAEDDTAWNYRNEICAQQSVIFNHTNLLLTTFVITIAITVATIADVTIVTTGSKI